ncbi:hypothetical protein KKF34_17995 [Myxococcota bacterium]|nr:hypothetical protein [Myxococcota bacterium]MBU1379892.1 hypothetical protein [Myxococcota bacterium]MBU1498777.1 hypothetical protein [Myxococcota bacterium]
MKFLSILEYLYTKACASCSKPVQSHGAFLCPDCYLKLNPRMGPFCIRCGEKIPRGEICGSCLTKPQFYTGISIFEYEGSARKLITSGKYGLKRWVFSSMGDFLADIASIIEWDYIIGVPVTDVAWRKRGFSHTDIVAKRIAANLQRRNRFLDDCFRKRDSQPQAGLTKSERLSLTSAAFIQRKSIPQGRILIIDDVITTGTTLRAFSKALKKAGAQDTAFLTFAKTEHTN